MANIKMIGGVVIFLIGLFIINLAFPIIPLPGFLANYQNWFLGIGGVIVIISSFKYFKSEAY